ncbi:MAG: hypothetical protein ACP5UQ_14590 [Anaerolineae bacterium]
MTRPIIAQTAARAYAERVAALLGPAAARPTERATRGGRAAIALADQAAALVPLSSRATAEVSQGIEAADPAERARAATQLLAKAIADLQVGALLLQAAMEESAGPRPRDVQAERAADLLLPAEDIVECLAILAGEEPVGPRAVAIPGDLPAARDQLTGLAVATLNLVQSRAARTGQTALSGLLVLGLGKVAEAAAIVGLDIAQALGVAEQVTRMYALARDYALNAYNAVAAVFGPAVVQSVVQQVLAWCNDVAAGQQFEQLLAQLYETEQTGARLTEFIAESQAGLAQFVIALQEVDGLRTIFQQQIGLVDRLLQGFRLFSGAAAVAIPQITVLMAAAYLVLIGYAVLAGADYVDAQRLRFLNRVPGVRQVVERSLGS